MGSHKMGIDLFWNYVYTAKQNEVLSKYEFYNVAEPAQHNAQLIIGNNGGGHNTCWEFHA